MIASPGFDVIGYECCGGTSISISVRLRKCPRLQIRPQNPIFRVSRDEMICYYFVIVYLLYIKSTWYVNIK
jgi:hypothetical protein